jgi:hypothetical protein
MLRRTPFAAVVVAIAITAGLTAYGSAGNSGQARAAVLPITSRHDVGGSLSVRRSTRADESFCKPIPALPGWYGIYSACASATDAFTQLTNESESGVLDLWVPAGESIPYMSISAPQTGWGLLNLVEEREFSVPIRGYLSSVEVPPESTLTSISFSGPVHLYISVGFSATLLNIAATGLFDVVKDSVNPVASKAAAIVACAEYANSLHRQLNQWRPDSPEFWNNFANVADCSNAFKGWSEAIGGDGERTIIEDAASDTDGFFDDVLPKLISLLAEDLFH